MLKVFSEMFPARPVRLIQRVVGFICLLRVYEEYRVMSRVLKPQSIRFPIIEGLPSLTQGQAAIVLALWFGAALAFTIGWKTRICGFVLAAVMGYTLIIDQQLYASNLYLLCLIVLLLTLAEVGRPSGSNSVWRWPILLLQIQLSLVYFFAAVTKLNSVYLKGYMLGSNLRKELPAVVFTPGMLTTLAVASIVIELFLAAAFWVRSFRKSAVLVGVLFHLGMVLTITPLVAIQLIVFAVACIAIYPLFFFRVREATSTPATFHDEAENSDPNYSDSCRPVSPT
jgi:hypothetical protein